MREKYTINKLIRKFKEKKYMAEKPPKKPRRKKPTTSTKKQTN